MSPRKILALKLRSLGDTVLMTAPLLELRRAYPEARIHAAVMADWAPLLEGHPAVDRVWNYERRSEATARAKAITRLALRLRREKFDCVACFHASPSSATLAFATGAKVRSIHFHGHADRNRYSTVVVPGKGTLKPIIERDMDVVRALGIHVPAGRLPQVFLQEVELREARERLGRLGLPDPVLAICLGASRPTKAWPVERYAQLAIQWARRTGGGAVALAGPAEERLEHEFLRGVEDALTFSLPEVVAERAAIRARIAAERGLGIRALAALLSRASVVAGNDSGPRHLAVAVGAPTVTLFGPEHPFEWHPYPDETHPHLFVDGLACRRDAAPGMPAWCSLDVCVAQEHRCMRQLGVDPVLEQCLRVARKAAA
jgi:ADP-heptose:LPS heptosyltransferase